MRAVPNTVLKNAANRMRGLVAADPGGEFNESKLLEFADTLDKFADKSLSVDTRDAQNAFVKGAVFMAEMAEAGVAAAGGTPKTARRQGYTDDQARVLAGTADVRWSLPFYISGSAI